ncbi:MAG: alpha/beta hydrolase [Raineya sp.]|jgi:dienelactone hydrolase|nr:alpha/beta hydrolase [Raineya sp.]
MKQIFYLVITSLLLQNCRFSNKTNYLSAESKVFYDSVRGRKIPVEIYTKPDKKYNNQLVIINNGYGSSNTEYSYIAKKLINLGYIVACIQHEQPEDEAIPNPEYRRPVWERGVKNVEWVVNSIKKTYKNIDTNDLILIGHSNGGDITMLFSTLYPQRVAKAITLDHRRMIVPRVSKPAILSLRADEFEADKGVLPSPEEQKQFGIQIYTFPNSKHDYFRDVAPEAIKKEISQKIVDFIISKHK